MNYKCQQAMAIQQTNPYPFHEMQHFYSLPNFTVTTDCAPFSLCSSCAWTVGTTGETISQDRWGLYKTYISPSSHIVVALRSFSYTHPQHPRTRHYIWHPYIPCQHKCTHIHLDTVPYFCYVCVSLIVHHFLPWHFLPCFLMSFGSQWSTVKLGEL